MAEYLKPFVDAIKFLLENVIYILAAIGAAAVVVRAFDAVVERQIAKHPNSRFWQHLDDALDTTDTFLGVIIDGFHKVALRKPQDDPPK